MATKSSDSCYEGETSDKATRRSLQALPGTMGDVIGHVRGTAGSYQTAWLRWSEFLIPMGQKDAVRD
jgi:hypothetical protein